MKEWQDLKIGDVLSKIIGGGTPSKTIDEYWNGNIPWCSVKDMSEGKFQLSQTEDYITELGLKNSSSNLIQTGTVITSTRMGLGRAFVNNVDMAINQDLKALIPNDKIDNKFLLWTIISKKNELESLGTGATVKGIRLETLKDIKIKLPPLPIQQRIASILSAYDDLIENNLKRIKLLEELAQRTYEEWFVKFRINGKQLPIDENTGLPFGWEKKKIGNSCEVSGGGTPSKAIPEYWNNGDITWFSPTDLSKSNSLFQIDSGSKITSIGLKKSSAKLLESNSFMMTSRATIGLFAIIDKPFCTNQGFINVTPYELFHKEYLLYNFISRIEEFKGYATGATFPELSKSKFKVLDIVFPHEDILKEFHINISPIHRQIGLLIKSNDKLIKTREILLPRLMNGTIKIDEP